MSGKTLDGAGGGAPGSYTAEDPAIVVENDDASVSKIRREVGEDGTAYSSKIAFAGDVIAVWVTRFSTSRVSPSSRGGPAFETIFFHATAGSSIVTGIASAFRRRCGERGVGAGGHRIACVRAIEIRVLVAIPTAVVEGEREVRIAVSIEEEPAQGVAPDVSRRADEGTGVILIPLAAR